MPQRWKTHNQQNCLDLGARIPAPRNEVVAPSSEYWLAGLVALEVEWMSMA